MDTRKIAKNVIIVDYHIVYKRNLDGMAKARIIPWGYRNHDKDFLHGDASFFSLEVFHSLLSLAAEQKCMIGKINIETAFLQALGFNRKIYIRPSCKTSSAGVLSRLQLPVYVLTDFERLWYLTTDFELKEGFGLNESKLDITLCYSQDISEVADFILVAQVDDYLYTETEERMMELENFSRLDSMLKRSAR